jgi:hypothetical protein
MKDVGRWTQARVVSRAFGGDSSDDDEPDL